MSKRKVNFLLGSAALILGGLLYILFRSSSYVAMIFRDIRLVVSVRQILQPFSCDFLKYYFPDFLWGFSLCCGIQTIYDPGIKGTVICGCVTFLCGCVWETLQYLGVVSGTGDFLDVTMYLSASLLCILVNLKERVK